MKDVLTETTAAFVKTAAAVRPDQLGDPTPCAEYTVADLVSHLGEELVDSERAARKAPRAPERSGLGPAAAALAAESAKNAWLEPSAFEGVTDFGPGEMAASLAAAIIVHELALHTWDLARATGQDFTLTEASSRAVLDIVGQISGQARANGAYGPILDAAPEASAFERALAATGRDTAWKV